MKPSINPAVSNPPQWVQFCSPNTFPCWSHVKRLLSDIPLSEQPEFARLLQSGRPVISQSPEYSLQAVPMPDEDQQRLKQLAAFEQGGFELSTFSDTMALFHHPFYQEEYWSMNEVVERGYVPLPTITIDPMNRCVTKYNGQLLDVFVPVRRTLLNFIFHANFTIQ